MLAKQLHLLVTVHIIFNSYSLITALHFVFQAEKMHELLEKLPTIQKVVSQQ